MAWACLFSSARGDAVQQRGLPFIRTYPLDEIGNVPRSLKLGFDGFNRVAVMYDGVYSVLNDSAWVDLTDGASATRIRMTTIKFVNGSYFYGARGSWGRAEFTRNGHFKAVPLVPANAPPWTSVTPFNSLLTVSRGIYFYDITGIVYWDFAKQKNVFFEMPRLSAAFAVGDRVFASCQDGSLRELLPDADGGKAATASGLNGGIVTFAAPLDQTHTLLALKNGQLVLFDGSTAIPWPLPAALGEADKISAMEPLVDGGVAIAITGKGIFLFSADGALEWSLNVPEFRRIGSMAAGEPGVLWAVGENAVHRIYYDSALTSFGQELGITALWPRVASWNGSVVTCSSGEVSAMDKAAPGQLPRFHLLNATPPNPIECVAASGDRLLAGNRQGVSMLGTDGIFKPLISIENVAAMEFIEPDVCVVIGSQEITALQNVENHWVECAPRIAGVGVAPIRTQLFGHEAVWIEMGGDRVARLAIRDHRLVMDKIALPWREEQWTNVGVLGHTVVLSGATGRRTYFDERTRTLCEAPEIDRLLSRSPYWTLRIKEDAAGVLWATHAKGVVTFTPQGSDYTMDASTFELRNDSYPWVTILNGSNTWISASRSLYHVEPKRAGALKRPQPVLVSLVADRQDLELVAEIGSTGEPPRLNFDNNSLSFRFFSGTYSWRFPPIYEYRFAPQGSWAQIDPTQVLRFANLRDGAYRLEVRQEGPLGASLPPVALSFIIAPPWFRTPAAYALFSLVLLLAVVGIARWINRRSLKRNAILEGLVQKRTSELELAMSKLGEETKNAATLAERSRLAGEIHDSLQQGLSGAILHLDTTMTHASIIPEVYSRLNVARNMLSYSREEVQQAVWNLESPLLLNSTLGDALHKLAEYISAGTREIVVDADRQSVPLDQAVQHHLLRIAQEALTNAVKHAGSGRIELTLLRHPDRVVLTVIDHGVGFDLEARSKIDGHFGLRGIRSRAKSIKAQLRIESQAGVGTKIQATVFFEAPK